MRNCLNCGKPLTKLSQIKYCSRLCSIQSINKGRKLYFLNAKQQQLLCRKCRMVGRGLTIILMILVIIHILTGCSHSGAATTKVYGVHLLLPIPLFPIALTVGYVLNARTYMRLNTEAKLLTYVDSSAKAGAQTKLPDVGAKSKLGTKIEMKTGNQVNGYVRDILKDVRYKEQVDALLVIRTK